ncbi:MAG: hypothetical protein QHC88_20605 [Achromobacter sp.]|uniref:hypothetical protein n=1 Tax=Achromobacter sp. TaxID=134375 RepID=UPI0029BDAE48|nr:hypothetical protein [Achromobacter sp.]MDX3987660.1 hypothetical protein [Achromobacter sp.]
MLILLLNLRKKVTAQPDIRLAEKIRITWHFSLKFPADANGGHLGRMAARRRPVPELIQAASTASAPAPSPQA